MRLHPDVPLLELNDREGGGLRLSGQDELRRTEIGRNASSACAIVSSLRTFSAHGGACLPQKWLTCFQ
ncbi:hypothetical protein BN2476_500123 [Paraburkholderia piptadeniae]|uniref:Uncharacterized protein n=1 Tax=Paraburkholderia piptadeniae TaxID=1701573 RepID=A0A1N7SFY4_9BURK|nr:hypothetical protein BN2476_500123 [Paraburkholderia piptadeniae]